MKTRYLLQIALPALALATASADTIELKDGTKYQGTVLSKDGADYIVSVQIGKGIKDEKRIPKADVVSIVAEDKSETGFVEVAALIPVPDLTSAAEYDARLKKADAFLKAYKENKHRAELENIVSTLTSEGAAIKAGGVKMGGKITTAEERKPQAYTLDSQLAVANMKRLAEQGNTVGALRAWTAIEKDFGSSNAYKEALPFVTRTMQAYLARTTQMVADVPVKIKRREDDLKALSDQQRGTSKRVIEEEADNYRRLAEAEKSQQVKWPTLDPYVKAPIEETKRALDSEIKRLQSLSLATMPKPDEAYAKAWDAIHKEGATKTEINAALGDARNMYVPAAYLEILASSSPLPLDNK